MQINMLRINEKFLEEEVRCNYTVSTKMKKVWAVELDMLKKIDEICKKYDITYYADSGTLIGAIRHKGFIPWDDDIDIVMKREDYNKFLEVAKKEIEYPYFLQTAYTDINYCRAHAQLRNSSTTGFILQDEKAMFNKGIFLDIFPIDELPDSEIKLKVQLIKLKILWKIMKGGISHYKGNKYSIQHNILHIFSKIILKFVKFPKMYACYEKISSKYNNKGNRRISYIAYSKGKTKHIWKKEWFDEVIRMPFENIEINVPKGYDERLKKEYGDYMKISKAPTAHGKVVFEPDIPYEKYFEERDKE